MTSYQIVTENDLVHHGIKGMKWGVRRYRNEDGTLTAAGKKRYGSSAEAREEYGKAKVAYNTARSKPSNTASDYVYNTLTKRDAESKMNAAKEKYVTAKRAKITADTQQLAKKRAVVTNADQLTQQSKRTASGLRNISQKREQNKLLSKDLSKMTDQELREVINRRSLERQYLQATADQKARGRDYVMDVLDVAGGVLGTVGSALAIAIAINTLRNK